MMKAFTLAICALVGHGLSAQFSVLDSLKCGEWNGSSFDPYQLTTYAYDLVGSQMEVVQSEYKMWNGSSYDPVERHSLAYSGDGLSEVIIEEYNGSSYDSICLLRYTYDGGGKWTWLHGWDYNAGVWDTSGRMHITYDGNDDTIAKVIEEYSGGWMFDRADSFFYTSPGVLDYTVFYTYSTQFDPETRTDFTFDGQARYTSAFSTEYFNYTVGADLYDLQWTYSGSCSDPVTFQDYYWDNGVNGWFGEDTWYQLNGGGGPCSYLVDTTTDTYYDAGNSATDTLSSCEYIYKTVTGMGDEPSVSTIAIVPNPAGDVITVDVPSGALLRIVDGYGRVIVKRVHRTPIDVSHFAPGMYYIVGPNGVGAFVKL